MKKILLATMTILSFSSFAEIRKEFDENIEKLCHQQLKHLQCLKKDDNQSAGCIEAKWSQISPVCQQIFKRFQHTSPDALLT